MPSRHPTPTTPFIPPLLSPEGSPNPPQHAPVIPGSPNYASPYLPGNYPVYPTHSPYSASPFIPPSPLSNPPGSVPPPLQNRQHSRQGVSADYTGYPQGNPYTPPMASPQHIPPPPLQQGPYAPPPFAGWHTPSSAPAAYPTFQQPGGSPWAPPGAFPINSPYAPPSGRLPPQPHTPYTPYTPAFMPGAPLPGGPPAPGPGWNVPPPGQFYPPQQDPNAWHYAQQQQQRAYPEPPPQVYDRMGPFTQGNHYGPVLDPFLVKVVKAQVAINPLIQPLPEDGPEQKHLNWNMLFPTSTVQRSGDPSHVSWSNGREEPATFPRLSSLKLVSDYIPWLIDVKAKDPDRGVTCGEVIEAIGYDLSKFSNKQDFDNLPPQDKQDLTAAYRWNRSRNPGVPGGSLGQGMKRLDFLRKHTMFAGIENNERTVRRVCGEALPCVFALKCAATYMTKDEIKQQESRMRASSAHGSRNSGPRSRANSTNTRITVQAPSSTTGDSDDDEDGDYDR
ncbi:hypothetical protein BDZ97DRAFT_1799648 [Flammula alnicola]|nr:hypothetical protein BDZ97DRAFT_1799648 [Flammula alnicola]